MTTHLALVSSVVFVIVLALPIFFHLTRYVGARSDNERKNEPYESGVGGAYPYGIF